MTAECKDFGNILMCFWYITGQIGSMQKGHAKTHVLFVSNRVEKDRQMLLLRMPATPAAYRAWKRLRSPLAASAAMSFSMPSAPASCM